jgi:hypothetical protein
MWIRGIRIRNTVEAFSQKNHLVRHSLELQSNEPEVLRRVLDGFAKCALVAAHYAMSDVLDNLVISLTKFTTLLHHSSSAAPLHTPDTFRIAYGANAKALLATRAVFSLTHKASGFWIVALLYPHSYSQSCGFEFGSGSIISNESGSRVLMTKN